MLAVYAPENPDQFILEGFQRALWARMTSKHQVRQLGCDQHFNVSGLRWCALKGVISHWTLMVKLWIYADGQSQVLVHFQPMTVWYRDIWVRWYELLRDEEEDASTISVCHACTMCSLAGRFGCLLLVCWARSLYTRWHQHVCNSWHFLGWAVIQACQKVVWYRWYSREQCR